LTGVTVPCPTQLTHAVFEKGVSETLASIAVIGAAFPILGMVVRVFSVVLWSPFQYHDEARKLIGNLSREALSTTEGLPNKVRERIISKIDSAPDDSLFIWYALSRKPKILVEWARNRRHYQYYNVSSPVGQNLREKGVGRTRGF